MTRPTIHANPHHVPCDTFGCRTMAKWFIGREDGPIQLRHKLCDECAKHMLKNLPQDLLALLIQELAQENAHMLGVTGEADVTSEVTVHLKPTEFMLEQAAKTSEVLTDEEKEDAEKAIEAVAELAIRAQLEAMTLTQLRDYCKEHALTGYSGLNKPELIEAIIEGV